MQQNQALPSASELSAHFEKQNQGKTDAFKAEVLQNFKASKDFSIYPISLGEIHYQWQADLISSLFAFDPNYKVVIKKTTCSARNEDYEGYGAFLYYNGVVPIQNVTFSVTE